MGHFNALHLNQSIFNCLITSASTQATTLCCLYKPLFNKCLRVKMMPVTRGVRPNLYKGRKKIQISKHNNNTRKSLNEKRL